MSKDFDSKLLKNVLDEIKRLKDTLTDLETYKDEFTEEVIQSNGKATFTLPNVRFSDNYGYQIYYVRLNSMESTIPKYSEPTIAENYNAFTEKWSLEIEYPIIGGTNGTSKFRLRILK